MNSSWSTLTLLLMWRVSSLRLAANGWAALTESQDHHDEKRPILLDEQSQSQAIGPQSTEEVPAPEGRAPLLETPVEDSESSIVLEGPHLELPQFCIGSSNTIGTMLLRPTSRRYQRAAGREATLWQLAPTHPHILPFWGTYKIARKWYCATPFLQAVPIQVHLRENPSVDRHALISQVCDALVSLHSANILHGRIGTRSILVSKNKAIIYNFNKSKNQVHDFREDVFDFGITIAEILNGRHHNHTIFRIFKTRPSTASWVSPSGACNRELWDAARWCWRRNPSERPSMIDVLNLLRPPSLDSVAPDNIQITPGIGELNGMPGLTMRSRPISGSPYSAPSLIYQDCRQTPSPRNSPQSVPPTPEVRGTSLDLESNPQGQCITLPGLPPLRYRRVQAAPHARGGFSDVWMCEALPSDKVRQLLAEKVLRGVEQLPQLEGDAGAVLRKRLRQEVTIWMKLSHRSIAPLLGFTLFPSVTLISPWYPNGNIHQYLRRSPNSDRLKLLQEVASGLTYLHEFDPPVVHGDTKPDNILINDCGSAVIIDFGLSRSMAEAVSALISSRRGAGNVRWMAPELVDGSDPKSPEADVYSFACLAFHVLTDLIPFKNLTKESAIVVAIFQGESPASAADRFTMLSNPALENLIWALIDDCWTRQPSARPSMGEIEGRIARMRELSSALLDLQPPEMPGIPGVDEAGEEDEAEQANGWFETQVVGPCSSAVHLRELEDQEMVMPKCVEIWRPRSMRRKVREFLTACLAPLRERVRSVGQP